MAPTPPVPDPGTVGLKLLRTVQRFGDWAGWGLSTTSPNPCQFALTDPDTRIQYTVTVTPTVRDQLTVTMLWVASHVGLEWVTHRELSEQAGGAYRPRLNDALLQMESAGLIESEQYHTRGNRGRRYRVGNRTDVGL